MEQPTTLDVDDWARYLVQTDRPLTFDDIETAIARCGRNAAPWLTYCAICVSRRPVAPEVAAKAVPNAWTAAEFPQSALTQEDWRELFQRAGYTVAGIPSPRPTAPLTLYRGSTGSHRRRWSWTGTQSVAERFAVNRAHQFAVPDDQPAALWRATVEPWRLFAHIPDGREEDEYVIDTRGLRIERVEFGAIAAMVADRISQLSVVERRG